MTFLEYSAISALSSGVCTYLAPGGSLPSLIRFATASGSIAVFSPTPDLRLDLASSSATLAFSPASTAAIISVPNVPGYVPFPTLETLAGPAPPTTPGTLGASTLDGVGTMDSPDTGTPPSVGPTIGFVLASSLIVCPSGAP